MRKFEERLYGNGCGRSVWIEWCCGCLLYLEVLDVAHWGLIGGFAGIPPTMLVSYGPLLQHEDENETSIHQPHHASLSTRGVPADHSSIVYP
jgi:hypothetical protein